MWLDELGTPDVDTYGVIAYLSSVFLIVIILLDSLYDTIGVDTLIKESSSSFVN